MSVLILPVAIVIAFYAKEILLLWTGNSTTVEQTHLILSILVTGTALNGLMHLPYALQFAHGWTKLAFLTNVVSVIVLTPLIIVMASLYGALGAALIWVIFNSGLALVGIQLMHRRVLKGEQWKWCVEDVGLPMAAALAAAFCCMIFAPRNGPPSQQLMVLGGVSLFIMGSTLLVTPVTRHALFAYVRAWTGRAFFGEI